jgi:vacuolar-type H+-ATPase subunit H
MSASRESVSEIERLLDELESYSEKSPFISIGTGRIVIPDDEFFVLLGRIRESLPIEIKQSRETLEKRDQILRTAQDEHRRIMDSAEKRLEDLLGQDHVVVAARREAEKIIEVAQRDGEHLRADALAYTAQVLADLEKQFGQALTTIQKGREHIERQMAQQQAEPEVPAEARAS